MSTTQRLVHYAMKFKKPIFIGLILFTLAVFTDLVGPFIAKHIIAAYMKPGAVEF